jgi:putative oxidoreductase
MFTAPLLEASASATARDAGLLIARLVVGPLMMAHATQKLFGWLGGYGLTGTGGFFEQLGFRPGRMFAAIASSAELVGGLLIAFGLFGPVGPALVLSVMIVAAVSVHWGNGLFAGTNGIEVPLLIGTFSVMLALTGPGLYSLDAWFSLESLWSPKYAAIALAVGVIGAMGNLLSRRPAPAGSGVGVGAT